MKQLVIIPARGGSKGVPGKNIKLLGGKPLIQYTLEAAREVFPDEQICVSTDDEAIKDVVESFGLKVPFLRPAHLATDESGTYEVLLHAVAYYEAQGYKPDTLILLQPTSPFRTARHIREAIAAFDENCEMVVSVKETKANPYYILREDNEEGWLVKSKEGNFTRRQDCPKVWEVNGALYVIDAVSLKKKPLQQMSKVRKYIMGENSSHDIDSELDWLLAEVLNKNRA
ncbi:MAG: acylneuraminate cytidylyltransferase family protein [Phaeodactylibacter sp.]|uniref:acylneuraminate cytidylyltransferase family protein n=1 Tax=Phaeodactylibacter sp. TaxID=1940289 RepID=UPI0032EAA8BB